VFLFRCVVRVLGTMTEGLFREHLQGVFPQTCLNLSRKLWSLEQFAKFATARAKLSLDYAHGLERLSQKTKGTANLFFEESEVSKLWTQILQTEVDFAKEQATLATALQERVADQLNLVKTTTEGLLKGIEGEGQSASKILNESIQALAKANDLFQKVNKELEAEEYKRREEATKGMVDQVQKRDKKIAKCRADVESAEAQYRAAIDAAAQVQSKHFDEKLPGLLNSLQMVFTQRLSTIQDAFSEFSSSLLAAANASVPLYTQMDEVVKQFSVQREIEEYVSKTELYFTAPATPTFQPFVKTPEGQVPALITEKQSSWAGKFHQKLSALASSSPVSFLAAGNSNKSSGLLLGKTLDVIMQQQASKYPKLKVPYAYVFLCDAILKLKGRETMGVFRLSGLLSSIEDMKHEFDAGKYRMPDTVHDASSLFKFFLRSLPDSLVPMACYDAAISEPPTSHDVFNNLPEPNKTVAGFVLRYVRDYFMQPDIIAVTQMGIENLITVFVPCFLRSQSTDLMDFLKHADQERAWMRKCLLALDVSHYPSLDDCLAAAQGCGDSSAATASPVQRRIPPPVSSKPHPAAPRKALPQAPQSPLPQTPPSQAPVPQSPLPQPPTSASAGSPGLASPTAASPSPALAQAITLPSHPLPPSPAVASSDTPSSGSPSGERVRPAPMFGAQRMRAASQPSPDGEEANPPLQS